jgi:hypothetical protein
MPDLDDVRQEIDHMRTQLGRQQLPGHARGKVIGRRSG